MGGADQVQYDDCNISLIHMATCMGGPHPPFRKMGDVMHRTPSEAILVENKPFFFVKIDENR